MRHALPSRRSVRRTLILLMLAAGFLFLAAPPLVVEAAAPFPFRFALVFYWYSAEGPQVRVSTIIEADGPAPAPPLTLALIPGDAWTPGAVKVMGAPGVTVEAPSEGTAGRTLVNLPAGFRRVVLSLDGTLALSGYQNLVSGDGRYAFRLEDFAFRPWASGGAQVAPDWQISLLTPDGFWASLPDGRELPMGVWAEASAWVVAKGRPVAELPVPAVRPAPPGTGTAPTAETPGPASLEGPAVVVDGMVLPLHPSPRTAGGCLLVPLRAVVETLGGQVIWDSRENKALVAVNGRTSAAKTGSYLARGPDGFLLLSAAPAISEGRLWVPPELVAGIFGMNLWVDAARGIAAFRRATPSAAPPAAPDAPTTPPVTAGTVYVTIDDGPSKLTPRFLDVLARRRAPATFFVIGTNALSFPETLRRADREGHEIGNHTYDHDYAHIYTERAGDFWDSVFRAEEVIRSITGHRTQVIRTPGGRRLPPELRDSLSAAGYRLAWWNCTAADTAVPAPDAWTIFDNVVSGVEGRTRLGQKETIVLMHDSAGHEHTLEALPFILDHLLARGYVLSVFDPPARPPARP